MPIAVEYYTLTGTISNPGDGLIPLRGYPTTGPAGTFDIEVTPIHGRSQRLGQDFGLTGAEYNILTYNLEGSAIKGVRLHDIDKYGVGFTGPEIRVTYNRE